jgi:hypothetical protein
MKESNAMIPQMTPPTDNLYKFSAILGLIMFILCGAYLKYIGTAASEKNTALSIELITLEAERKKSSLDSHWLVSRFESFKTQFDRFKKQWEDGAFDNHKFPGPVTTPEGKQLVHQNDEYMVALINSEKAMIDNEMKLSVISEKEKHLHQLTTQHLWELLYLAGVMACAVQLSFWGFRNWNKHQKLLDAQMEALAKNPTGSSITTGAAEPAPATETTEMIAEA